MNFTRFFTLLFLIVAMQQVASAQLRYVDPVFSQASATTILYGQNFTVLPLVSGGRPVRQPLVARVYTPAGDTDTKRPLIIYLKTGNFFPFPANGSCGGTLGDSSNVEFATRLAKMGYVVAVADYRGGWNPTANDPVTGELTRRFTLINAAYRGVQDVRTCIRFFRKSVDLGGNPFGIDPDKIVVWGQGTGGYLSLASAYMESYNEIFATNDPNKFKLPTASGPVNMVLPPYNGDIFGNPPAPLTACVVDATYSAISGGAFLVGDTLCVPNHVGYSSDFNLCVNMGGALGDSSWMDKGEIPLISYHVLSDEFAPCNTNILKVPTAGGALPVMEVTGSCDLQDRAEAFGNNVVFESIPAFADPYATTGYSGYIPFSGTPNNTSSPWEWTKTPTTPPTPATCNGDGAVARDYIDTIITYYAPRACFALNLPCKDQIVNTKNLPANEVGLNVAPVPTSSELRFSAKELIRSINVYDLNGRVVRTVNSVDNTNYTLQRQGLTNGLYIIEARFDKGAVRRKVIFE
jgi:acetyl esterase/lipase